jgi:hypothetical protein
MLNPRAPRRALASLLLGVSGAFGAEAEFPASLSAAGHVLLLNGTGARRYLGIEVYRAALYLERRSDAAGAILAAPGPKLVLLRYRREVPLAAVARAWEDSFAATCACPVPDALRAWFRAIRAGDTERYLILPDAAEVAANDAPAVRIPGPATAQALLASFIGPASPTEALRRGLLGQR